MLYSPLFDDFFLHINVHYDRTLPAGQGRGQARYKMMVVGAEGIEPSTLGLRGPCSAN
jgi:hypothetical protein